MKKFVYAGNPKLDAIFNDLEGYLEFCVAAGYKWDESTLYDMRNYTWQQYQKWLAGKNYKDCWAEDAKKFAAANGYAYEE